ncbi:MAG: Ig-like domain-containing protein, partial [Planctomycetota bacterium]
DSQDPTVTITSPTSDPTYNVNNSNFNISGSASDDVGVVSVSWSNDRGGSGSCTGTTSWSKTGITLLSGVNVITITAQDAATKTGTDILTVTYSPEFSFSGTSPEGVSLE